MKYRLLFSSILGKIIIIKIITYQFLMTNSIILILSKLISEKLSISSDKILRSLAVNTVVKQ